MSASDHQFAQKKNRNARCPCGICVGLLAGFLVFAALARPRVQMPFAGAPFETLQVSGPDVVIDGMRVAPKPGQPFIGKMLEEDTHVGSAHTKIHFAQGCMVARDSSGRVYYEERRTISKHGTLASRKQFFIVDRNAGTRTTCYPETKSCRIDELHIVSYEDSSFAKIYRPSSTTQTTSLGTSARNGLTVIGTRETTTIAAGFSDSNRPVVTGKEVFYCPELGLDIALKVADPRRGMWAREIQGVVREEPNASEFGIPTTYKVFDNRPSE